MSRTVKHVGRTKLLLRLIPGVVIGCIVPMTLGFTGAADGVTTGVSVVAHNYGDVITKRTGATTWARFDSGTARTPVVREASAERSESSDRRFTPAANSRFATNSLPVHAPGSLSAAEAHSFYRQGENAIAGFGDDLAARGVGLEARAREMFETRNALRSHVRDLMADQNAANYLRRTSPHLTESDVGRNGGEESGAGAFGRRHL